MIKLGFTSQKWNNYVVILMKSSFYSHLNFLTLKYFFHYFYGDKKQDENMKKIILLFFLVISTSIFCKDQEKVKNKDDSLGWLLIPGAFYTPETSVGFILGLIYQFQISDNADPKRPSYVSVTGTYTLENQYRFIVVPHLYFDKTNYLFKNRFIYLDYPDKFFGIGNKNSTDFEKYKDSRIFIETSFQKKFFNLFYAGLFYLYQRDSIKNKEPGSSLDQGKITGSGLNVNSGLGIIFTIDFRDNIFYPRKGGYFQGLYVVHEKAIQSDTNFRSQSFDIRQYFTLYKNHILAYQLRLNFTQGEIPFLNLPVLGGDSNLRGVFRGRYRDRNMIALQAEYRFPIYQRLKGVLFSGIGDVAEQIDEFRIENFKLTYGLGFRIKLTKNDINVRMDIGYYENEIKTYFAALEAF